MFGLSVWKRFAEEKVLNGDRGHWALQYHVTKWLVNNLDRYGFNHISGILVGRFRVNQRTELYCRLESFCTFQLINWLNELFLWHKLDNSFKYK